MTPKEQLWTLIGLLLPIIGGGTVFFHIVEGWSWVDSYFFSVVTLSTVGYGEPVPVTALGKIGATVFIFVGLGVFALVIKQMGEMAAIRRRRGRSGRLLSGHKSQDDSKSRDGGDEPRQ